MAEDNQKTKKATAIRVSDEKIARLKRVRRGLASAEDRDLSDVALLDEIIEDGLKRRERKLGI